MGIRRRDFLSTAALAAPAVALAQPRRPVARAPRLLPAQYSWAPPPAQAPAREGLADLPGVRLFYSDTGGPGEPLVLLHPATGSAKVWGYQQPVFARAGYRVIAYSRRSHAGSESGAPDALGTAVDDLDALLNHLKVGRFHLLGSAAGGFIGPDYALTYPDRLLSMVLACTQGGVTEPTYRKTIDDLNPPEFDKLPASFREVGPSYRVANPAGVAEWERLEHISRSGPVRLRQPAKNRILWPDLERIRTPALVIGGAADLLMPPALMLEYASHLTNAETAILSESGHSGYWEQPEAFNTLVLDFLARHPARP